MRTQYIKVMNNLFHERLSHYRDVMGISQEEMAHYLAMGCRNYVYLDHGKKGCSALTLVRFLIYICDNPICFLKELKSEFEQIDQSAA